MRGRKQDRNENEFNRRVQPEISNDGKMLDLPFDQEACVVPPRIPRYHFII